jgi:hypothetical protein
MGLFLKKSRRDSMQQFQLNLAGDERIDLDRKVERQLVELMAKMMLAVMLSGKETSDDHPTS